MSTSLKRVLIAAAGVLTLALATGIVANTLGASRGAPADRRTERAPIEAVEVTTTGAPAQYVVKVRAGLPNGCAQKAGHQVSRTGELIEVTVLNSQPTGNQICTMIYGIYDLSIDVGTDFRRGVKYTVRVNDKTATFVAQ